MKRIKIIMYDRIGSENLSRVRRDQKWRNGMRWVGKVKEHEYNLGSNDKGH